MMAGVLSYDETIETLRSEMAKAGWDRYMSAISEQVAAQLAE